MRPRCRLRKALTRIDAGPDGDNMVIWTSLREVCCIYHIYIPFFTVVEQEPVIYIAGQPHVLRLQNRPMENVE